MKHLKYVQEPQLKSLLAEGVEVKLTFHPANESEDEDKTQFYPVISLPSGEYGLKTQRGQVRLFTPQAAVAWAERLGVAEVRFSLTGEVQQ
ncbi:MAG: hypothetical protein AB7E47_12620 [Desulfovibrionaceae bacterium]